ncbi:MAG: DNA translocase FtsK [Deltaproteobacteria bacterium]|nr:DNA translocase FtsK [Deltaproteobacteria bacterium]
MAEKEGIKSSHVKEIIGIFVLASCLFITISLLSYSEQDPAFLQQGIDKKTLNWGGRVGLYTSDGLFFLIGFSAYLLPLILFVVSIKLFLKKDPPYNASVVLSLLSLLASFSGLIGMLSADRFTAGGLIGGYIDYFLEGYLNTIGTVILLSAIAAVSMVYGTGISIVSLSKRFYAICDSTYKIINGQWLDWKERRKKSRDAKAKVQKKEIDALAKPDDKIHAAPIVVISEPSKEQFKRQAKSKEPVQQHFEFLESDGKFTLPPLSLLDINPEKGKSIDKEGIITNSKIVEKKLKDFGVDGTIVAVRPGPVITMYEFEPAPGIKVGKIINLTDDLALALRATSIRILAPVPGKAVVGIEVPNLIRGKIFLRDIMESQEYVKSHSFLTLGLGKDLVGNPFVSDLAKMPHLLLAGATGTGKSVAINAMILSILYKASPDDVKFIMIDPKMLELSAYEGIPHLLTPVVTDPRKAAGILRGVVREMGERYKLIAEFGAKNIARYNQMLDEGKEVITKTDRDTKRGHERLPYIVVVIDELADLMMVAGKDVEDCLVRLSQMARASGIHLLVATQRPSVDVITGLIKANFPARISCQVVSRTDSRTILDSMGAESLLGDGDMLFLPPGTAKLQRIHGGYVSEIEINRIAEFLKKQGSPVFHREILEAKLEDKNSKEQNEEDDKEFNSRYDEAVNIALQIGQISTSYIQRRLRIGYNTAARIIEKMEAEGVVGPSQGSKPREVLARREI